MEILTGEKFYVLNIAYIVRDKGRLKNMKKKLICSVLILSLIGSLSACKNSSKIMIPYDEASNTTAYAGSNSINPSYVDLFAKDLCIIPVGEDTDKDGNLKGNSTMLVDITDQKVIYASNIYEKLYPASITKIVTAFVVLKYGNLEDTVTISKKAANISEAGAKKCGFKEGDQISLDALLHCFLVYSGNDAGIALAEHIAESEEEFAKMMNKEMKALGAIDSNFVNSHGLHDDNHYTTAYDIYLVFHELIQNETFLNIIKNSSYKVSYKDKNGKKYSPKTFSTTNRYLLGNTAVPEGVTILGGKTGTTSKAGSCLILYSKDEKEHEYLSFIFHADSTDSLFSQMTYLLNLANR